MGTRRRTKVVKQNPVTGSDVTQLGAVQCLCDVPRDGDPRAGSLPRSLLRGRRGAGIESAGASAPPWESAVPLALQGRLPGVGTAGLVIHTRCVEAAGGGHPGKGL